MSKQQTTLSSFLGGKPGKKRIAEDESESGTSEKSPIASSSTSNQTMSEKKQKTSDSDSTTRKFNPEWLNEFRWLRHEDEKGGESVMYCKICEAAKKVNGFTKGCINLRKSALKEHRDCASHYQAVTVMYQKNAMAGHMEQAKEKGDEKLTAMLNTVLFMAHENIATVKFSKLIELQKTNGCAALKGESYTHSDSIEEMEHALVESTIADLKEKIQKSGVVGLVIDETVNVTVEKKLILFIRIHDSGKPETIFLGNFSVHSGTAECVTEKIREILPQWNIDMQNVVGLGSDGASVMTGKDTGVGVRLQSNDSPYLVHVHCVAHRVALASADAAKVSKVVAEYRRTLNDIYKFYEYSATRYNRLKELTKVLEDADFSSVKQPSSVRWLSVGRAVKSIKELLPALVMEIEEEAAERNNPTAVNIEKKIKTYAFVAMTYMLSDVMCYMDKLVTLFQRDNLNLGMVMPVVNSTIASLRDLVQNLGHDEQYFIDNVQNGEFRGMKLKYADARSVSSYKKTRNGFIEELCTSLQNRFPDDSLSVLTSLDKVLNPSRYPATNDELSDYARDSLQVLMDQFGKPIGQEVNDVTGLPIDRERTERDFRHFKSTVSGLGTVNLEETCKVILQNYADMYPDYAVFASVALVIPVSSVPAERGFSLQNRIHSASRNRLCERRLNNLMLMNMHTEQRHTGAAVRIFRNKKRKI